MLLLSLLPEIWENGILSHILYGGHFQMVKGKGGWHNDDNNEFEQTLPYRLVSMMM